MTIDEIRNEIAFAKASRKAVGWATYVTSVETLLAMVDEVQMERLAAAMAEIREVTGGIIAERFRLVAALREIEGGAPVVEGLSHNQCRWCDKWTAKTVQPSEHKADCPVTIARGVLAATP